MLGVGVKLFVGYLYVKGHRVCVVYSVTEGGAYPRSNRPSYVRRDGTLSVYQYFAVISRSAFILVN